MTRFLSATVLDEPNLAGETQVELTFETLDIRRGDWKAVGEGLSNGTMPMRQTTEIRSYANRDMAERAIINLQHQQKSA